jgi:catechol 2,3-dioxygenase-like lactoylglutathione lyase family enzyme
MKHVGMCLIAAAALVACQSTGIETDSPNVTEVDLESGVKGVRFIGKTVSDIDETLAFYQGVVPYTLVRRDRVDPAMLYPSQFIAGDHDEIEVALVDARNVFVQLVDFDPDAPSEPFIRPVKGPGYTHMCFISPASDSAFTKFRENGLTMVTRGEEPVDLGGYGMRYAYGLDPNGAMIETEVADTPRRDGGPWVGHIGSATPDADRMSEFYTKILGYGPRRRGEYSDRPLIDQVVGYDNTVVRSSWFAARNMEIEFWEYIKPRTEARDGHAMLDTLGYNMIAYEVEDLDAERARLADATVFSDPIMTPFGWRVATGLDPDGNIIALHERVSAPETESIDAMLWIDPATF